MGAEKEEITEMHALIQGDVQGVGFRYTTRHVALQLGILGTVRNAPDGRVEIYAQGTKSQLEALISSLKEDEFPVHIRSVSTNYQKPTKRYESFQIIN